MRLKLGMGDHPISVPRAMLHMAVSASNVKYPNIAVLTLFAGESKYGEVAH
jgi:hypothetical protein